MAGLSPTAARWDELWDFFLTAFCRWFLEHKPKENATVPWVHDACEIYLGEYTVDIVQISNEWKTVLVILYCLTFAVGVIGNISVLIILLVNKDIRFVTSSFLASLAISDLITVFFAIPSHLVTLLSPTWNLLDTQDIGVLACKAVTFMAAFAAAANVFTITGLAVERYIAVLHPLKTRILQSGKRISIILSAIWIMALIFAIPVPVFYELLSVVYWNIAMPANMTFPPPASGYSENNVPLETALNTLDCVVPKSYYGDWKIYRWSHVVLLFCLPLGVMSFCYFKIGRRLLKRTDPVSNGVSYIPRSGDVALRLRKKTARKVIVVLTCAVISFLVCWAPTVLFEALIVSLDLSLNDSTLALRHFFEWLAISTCAHNPILYTLLHEKFRKTLVNKLFYKRKGNRIHPKDASPGVSGLKSSTKESSDADILTSSGDGPTLLISMYKDKKRPSKTKSQNMSGKLINAEELSEKLYPIRPRSMTLT